MGDAKKPGWGAFLPRFNIPETFGTALSYEAQLHWFLENWDQVADYANALEQPTVKVGKTEFPDTSNALLPSITNSGTDINAILDFTYPVIRTRFADPLEWDIDTAYDILTVVMHNGDSYTSLASVPAGTDITNTDYWALTGSFDASIYNIHAELGDIRESYIKRYPNVKAMKNDSKLFVGMFAITGGYHSLGDGGAGLYIATSAQTANGYDILSLSNGAVAMLLDTGSYRPEQFGAYGDGVHDDGACVARCIERFGRAVLNGTYAVSSAIAAHGEITGSGTLTSIDKDSRISAFLSHSGNLRVNGITFDCATNVAYVPDDYQNTYNVGINSYGVNYDMTVTNCKFVNVYNAGVNCEYSLGDITIDGCTFLPGAGNTYIADHVRFASCNSSKNITVTNCKFVGTGARDTSYCGVFLATNPLRHTVVSNNRFDKCGRYGPHRLGSIDGYSRNGYIEITNNVIENCSWEAIRVHQAERALIDGNRITMAPDHAITEWGILVNNSSVGGDPYEFPECIVTNNSLSTVGDYDVTMAIEVNNGDANAEKMGIVTVSGNTVHGRFSRGLLCDNCCTVLNVTNNMFDVISQCVDILEGDYSDCTINIANNLLKSSEPIRARATTGTSGGIRVLTNTLLGNSGYGYNGTGTEAIVIGNAITSYNGISGGSLVGLNSLYDMGGSVGIINAQTTYQNYRDGVAL